MSLLLLEQSKNLQVNNMPIPDFQSLMMPVLVQAADGEVRISDVVDSLALKLKLSDDDLADLLPSGKQTTFANRVHWAKSFLKQAGFVEATRRAHFRITDTGRSALESGIDRIDVNYLKQYPQFVAFQNRSRNIDESGDAIELAPVQPNSLKDDIQTPEARIRLEYAFINATLADELLERLRASSPAFFENVVVKLLVAMGYGGTYAEAGKAIGKSGDDGVDGVIDQDTLGLDRVYIQAKRYKENNTIGPGAIREFFGSLDMKKASKGIFVTTSTFSAAAQDTAEKLGKRIVLIEGKLFSDLLIRFNVGCNITQTFEMKKIDEEFFE
jgi:restriction system protein